MKPSRLSIRQILINSNCAIDFKINCKIMFGWTEKKFMSISATNHCFNALKNNKSKEWIIENVLTAA
jgi:hypothetical protein